MIKHSAWGPETQSTIAPMEPTDDTYHHHHQVLQIVLTFSLSALNRQKLIWHQQAWITAELTQDAVYANLPADRDILMQNFGRCTLFLFKKKKLKNIQLSARHYPSSQPVSIVVEGSGHNVCQQVQQPAGLSSGAADHHFTIVDTPLLDRTARAACPLGTDITLPLGGTITQQIQKPPCSTAPWVQDGGPQPKACRVRGTYKSTGRHTVSLCFACDKRCFFCGLLLLTNKETAKCWSLWRR